MKKIPTLFKRNPERLQLVTREVHPDCQWVLDGEGVATRKYDGTCVLFDGIQWWARREVKAEKTPPAGFVAVETDLLTLKTVGWEPAHQSAFWKHMEPVVDDLGPFVESGTYEFCGPKVNGNPERLDEHALVKHSTAEQLNVPTRDFDDLMEWLEEHPSIEGIVWHHPDGRMAKLKRRDALAVNTVETR